MKSQTLKGKKVLFITGSGISVDSGLPTYYGRNGIYRELENEFKMPISEALSATMFKNNPSIVWAHIKRIADRTGGAQPNVAHKKIREICDIADRCIVVTQNVDGFHSTKNDHDDLFEIHGNAAAAHCPKCLKEFENPIEMVKDSNPPTCLCGAVLKPNVVLFEEYPIFKGREDELRYFAREADFVVCVGTQVSFFYVADLLNEAALGTGEIHWVDAADVSLTENYMLHPLVSVKAKKFTNGASEYFSEIKL